MVKRVADEESEATNIDRFFKCIAKGGREKGSIWREKERIVVF